MMMYGKINTSKGSRFFNTRKNTKNKKQYVVSEPSSNTTHVDHPIIKDHLSHHILSAERAIVDTYRSKKPARLKVKSLSRNISNIKTFSRLKNGRNSGVYRITKTPKTPQPLPPPKNPIRTPKGWNKSIKPLTPLLDKGGTGADYVVRRLFHKPDDDESVESIIKAEKDAISKKAKSKLRIRKGNGLRWRPHSMNVYDWVRL